MQSALGPIRYLFQSMTDFTGIEDSSVDLVYSGQTIEHISEADGDIVLAKAFKALKPGGILCLDNPNRAVTEVQQESYIDPKHKIEYRHDELAAKLRKIGLVILEAKGMNYAGKSLEENKFSYAEVSQNVGLYSEIAASYILSYVCQKPSSE